MIVRIVKMKFNKEKISTFLQIFNESNSKISGFPGCKKLQLLREKSSGNVFFTYSFWENEESLENYRNSELFKEIWTQTKVLFEEKAEAWSTEIVDYT